MEILKRSPIQPVLISAPEDVSLLEQTVNPALEGNPNDQSLQPLPLEVNQVVSVDRIQSHVAKPRVRLPSRHLDGASVKDINLVSAASSRRHF